MKLNIWIKDLGLPKGTSHIDVIDAYSKAAENIKNVIEGHDTFSHTNGTNFIFVNAKWKGKEISKNMEKIKGNEYVANYQIIIHDPIAELETGSKLSRRF